MKAVTSTGAYIIFFVPGSLLKTYSKFGSNCCLSLDKITLFKLRKFITLENVQIVHPKQFYLVPHFSFVFY